MTYSNEDEKYLPDNIPSVINKTIYTHYYFAGHSWEFGELKNYDFDISGDTCCVVATTPITIHIPKVENLKQKVIEALEAEKKKQQAEYYKKMHELQEKVDALLCLEYHPKSEAEE